jgi:hypothetical protein
MTLAAVAGGLTRAAAASPGAPGGECDSKETGR